jgi:hypothetical protein
MWRFVGAALPGLILLTLSCSDDSTTPPPTQDNWLWEIVTGGFAPSAVWGSGASDVFFVEQVGTIGHYDGAGWGSVYDWNQGQGPGVNGLGGSGASDVLAVGGGGAIVHFDGTSWNALDSGTPIDLTAVCSVAPGEAYAVGRFGTILHGVRQ